MTRFCVFCKRIVESGHGRIVEVNGTTVRTCEPVEEKTPSSPSKRMGPKPKDRPVYKRLQRKLQRLASHSMLAEVMMTREQAEVENAQLPDGYKYILLDDYKKNNATLK